MKEIQKAMKKMVRAHGANGPVKVELFHEGSWIAKTRFNGGAGRKVVSEGLQFEVGIANTTDKPMRLSAQVDRRHVQVPEQLGPGEVCVINRFHDDVSLTFGKSGEVLVFAMFESEPTHKTIVGYVDHRNG